MDFLQYYRNRDTLRLRQAMSEIKDSAAHVDREILNDACNFFTRKDDFDQVRKMNVGRYAMTLVDAGKQDDEYNASIGRYEPYMLTDKREALKFYSGIYETICTGVGPTICNNIANMFTSWEQKFSFLKKDSAGTTAKDVEELINYHRESGLFDSRIVEVDYLASAVDSALLHIYMKGEDLAYDAIWPSSVHIVFGNTITETMKRGKVHRPVDFTDIEDASAVVICISGYSNQERNSAPDKKLFLAYVGGNEDQPMGRMVQYVQSEYWPIPDIGDASIVMEYAREGRDGKKTICNPLTFVMNNRKGGSDVGSGYEYPLVVIRGDQRFGSNDALPYSETFYQNCVEIESAWSQILRQGVKCARGKDVIHLNAMGDKLPESLEIVVLTGGQYQFIPGNASGVAQAVDTNTVITRAIGASRGVPEYIVIGAVQATPESGVSLAIRTQPLILSRNKRIKMNRGQVGKVYSIESALLTEVFPDLEKMFNGVKQVWDPGQWTAPQDEMERTNTIVAKRDAGFIDHFEAIREANRLPSIQDAKDLDKEMSKRDKDYDSADRKVADKKDASDPKPVTPTTTVNEQQQAQPVEPSEEKQNV